MNDTLDGGNDIDRLEGGAGADSLVGGAGNDELAGGAGNDTLDGGGGSDVFEWSLSDRGSNGSPLEDRVVGFDTLPAASGGDVLDLRDLLTGESASSGNLFYFMHFEKSGSDTLIHVSSGGSFASGYTPTKEDLTIRLQGVDLVTNGGGDQLIIQNLLNNNKLLTD